MIQRGHMVQPVDIVIGLEGGGLTDNWTRLPRDETREYAVKVMHHGGTKTVVFKTYSLSSALRELAETVAQFTDGFTTWKEL